MNEKVKNLLGVAIIISVVIVSFSVLLFVQFYNKSIEPSSFRSFSVSGEGKEVVIPDVVQFTFSVITQGGKNIGDLQRENTEKANKAIEFVKSKDVEEKDIKTQNYNVEPRYQYYNCPERGGVCPPPDIIGYTITQIVEVKVRNFDIIGDLLSGVVVNGANSVSSLNFTIDDPTEVQNKAREQAISKAKLKAESIAKAGGFNVGRLLSVTEGGQFPIIYEAKSLGMGGAMDSAPAPTIEPGSQEIIVNVTLTYEIE